MRRGLISTSSCGKQLAQEWRLPEKLGEEHGDTGLGQNRDLHFLTLLQNCQLRNNENCFASFSNSSRLMPPSPWNVRCCRIGRRQKKRLHEWWPPPVSTVELKLVHSSHTQRSN